MPASNSLFRVWWLLRRKRVHKDQRRVSIPLSSLCQLVALEGTECPGLRQGSDDGVGALGFHRKRRVQLGSGWFRGSGRVLQLAGAWSCYCFSLAVACVLFTSSV
jgi:hypothetical protein